MTTIACNTKTMACDPESGHVYKNGRLLGSLRKDGYLKTNAFGKQWLGHRLVWFMTYGNVPDIIDHINGNRSDNRISNLRASSKSLNGENRKGPTSKNKLKTLGVTKHGKGFHAAIRINGKQVHLGTYPTVELAQEQYLAAKRLHHEHNTL